MNWRRIELALHRVKIIRHNVSRIKNPEDPSYPYRLYVAQPHDEFHGAAKAIMFGGAEELVVRAKTMRGINWIIKKMKLRGNTHVMDLRLTLPDGSVRNLLRER